MLFKYSTKVLHIYKTGFHRYIQHTIPLFQEDCSLLQTYQTHKILRTFARKSLQPTIEKRSAHRHLSTESVDIKVCVAQMSQHQTGSFIYKSLVLRIQNSFCHFFECLALLIQDSIILFLFRSSSRFQVFIGRIRTHNLLGRSRLRSNLSFNKSKASVQ